MYKKKLVSIIIPCYNYGQYVGEALESIYNQTYQNFEIIFINDGSTDNTKEVAESFLNKGKIKIINQKNQGVGLSLLMGLKESSGEFISTMGSDDKLAPTFLEESINALERNPKAGVAYTQMRLFGDINELFKSQPYSLVDLTAYNYINGISVFRRGVYDKTKGFDLTLAKYEDWDLWLSFADEGFKGVFIPKPLVFYRKHGETRNTPSKDTEKAVIKEIRKRHKRIFFIYRPLYLIKNSCSLIRRGKIKTLFLKAKKKIWKSQ